MILNGIFVPEMMGGMGFLLIFLPLILTVIAQWKIFDKAGKPGWAILIPIYNLIVFLEIAGKSGWWIILFLIPGINIIFIIIALNGLSKSFGKSEGFTFGLIIFPFIFLLILAFGDAEYIGPNGIRENVHQTVYQTIHQHGTAPNYQNQQNNSNYQGQHNPSDFSQNTRVNQPIGSSNDVNNKRKFCTNCGNQILSSDLKFCTNCGTKII